jgi:hypothetical protein
MHLFNYVVGTSFPPSMPKDFDENKFGRIDAVFFSLAHRSDTPHGEEIAKQLQSFTDFRGLVYLYSPAHRGYPECANFFHVVPNNVHVVVTFKAFKEYFFFDSDNKKRSGHNEEIVYARIYENVIRKKHPEKDITEAVLYAAKSFFEKGKDVKVKDYFNIGIITKGKASLFNNTNQVFENTELKLAFEIQPDCFLKFEHDIFNAFKRFASNTDDVILEPLYPTHLSDKYDKFKTENKIYKYPAAIFRHRGNKLTIERDVLEYIYEEKGHISFLISDIHKAMILGNYHLAKNIVDNIKAKVGIKTSSPKVTNDIDLKPEHSGNNINQTQTHIFKEAKGSWVLCFEGETFYVHRVWGMNCIQYLLKHPGQKFSVMELDAAVRGTILPDKTEYDNKGIEELNKNGIDIDTGRYYDTIIDEDTRKYYESEIDKRKKALEKPELLEVTQKEELETELKHFVNLLRSAIGKKGELRRVPGPYERTRKNIKNAIDRAKENIKANNLPLWKHLDDHIKTGDEVSYKPGKPLIWDFGN